MKHAFVVPGTPIGKPRQTRSDRWKVRDVVARYRAWCDLARACAARGSAKLPSYCPHLVDWVAMFQMPRTPAGRLKHSVLSLGGLHQRKPDRDNVDKALLDALFKSDEGVAGGLTLKTWCVANPRLVVVLWYDELPSLARRRKALDEAGAATLPPALVDGYSLEVGE